MDSVFPDGFGLVFYYKITEDFFERDCHDLRHDNPSLFRSSYCIDSPAPTYNTRNVFNAAIDNKGIVVLPTSRAATEDTISGAILFLYKWRTFYLFINKVMLKRKVDLKFTKSERGSVSSSSCIYCPFY